MSACPNLSDIDLADYEDVEVDLQGDLPKAVKECEKSIREDDPSIDKETAIAICQDMHNQGELADDCPEGQYEVDGECKDIEEAENVPPGALSLPSPMHLQRFNPDTIERLEDGDNTVRYTNIKLIGPGVWVDSNSKRPVRYTPELMENMDVHPDNSVHVFHDSGNDASEIGHIDPESVENAENGVFGDIVIDTSSPAGEFADENMQATLESGGAKGFGGPSVEIPPEGQEIRQGANGEEQIVDGSISGAGLVSRPASKDVTFARQTGQAAVALADGSDAQSLMVPSDESSDMSDAFQTLTESDLELEAVRRALQSLEMVQDVIEQAETEGFDSSESTVVELIEFVRANLDVDDEAVNAIEDAADAYLETVEASSLDATSAEGFRDWAVEQGAGDDEEGEEADMQEDEDGEGEEEAEEEDDDTDPDVDEQMDALEQRISAVEDMLESVMTEEELEELADAEDVKELAEAKEELEERVRELEEEPKTPKTLSGDAEIDGEESEASDEVLTEMAVPTDPY